MKKIIFALCIVMIAAAASVSAQTTKLPSSQTLSEAVRRNAASANKILTQKTSVAPKIKNDPGKTTVASALAPQNKQNFGIGASGYRLLFFASFAANNKEALDAFVKEIGFHYNLLQGQPSAETFKASVDKLAQSGDLKTFTEEFLQISKSYAQTQTPEGAWFLSAGLLTQGLYIMYIQNDAQSAQSYTQNLQQLINSAPVGAPANVVAAMKKAALIGGQPLANKTQFDAAAQTVAEIFQAVG